MHGTREIIRLGSNDIFSPEELTAKAFRRAEWKLRIAQASASGSTMREVLGLFAILADGARAFTADINVAGMFESREACRAATLALAEVALASR